MNDFGPIETIRRITIEPFALVGELRAALLDDRIPDDASIITAALLMAVAQPLSPSDFAEAYTGCAALKCTEIKPGIFEVVTECETVVVQQVSRTDFIIIIEE